MCGLAGFLDTREIAGEPLIAPMLEALTHRGPDDAGVFRDAGLVLGHRRLSVLDLSPEGHQPMVSACGRYVMAFNGEVYNHAALREALDAEGPTSWRGHSDTEVMLAAVARWGLEAALGRFVGMFAFALWDRQARRLSLARDRLGEKPLYYGWQDGVFLFASELKALRAHPAWRGGVAPGALALFMRHGFVPTPLSIHPGIYKLPPGTWLALDEGTSPGALPAPSPYWSLSSVIEAGRAAPFAGSEQEAIDALERHLGEAVALQRVADVPLGAFLSGGIDSSVVVALMQSQAWALGQEPVRTYTIGFHEKAYDEAGHAEAVARHLGTRHTALYVSPEDAQAVIPRLPWLYDEPFADVSQIPTYLVCALARREVTVALSGDGGDELFGGYERYRLAGAPGALVEQVPASLRRLFGRTLSAVPLAAWDALFARLPARLRVKRAGDRVHKLAQLLAEADFDAVYRGAMSHWSGPEALVRGLDSGEPLTVLSGAGGLPPSLSRLQRMMARDTLMYLPDDILVKVDRAAMAVSLETRVPLLDHRLVEFAWSLPEHYRRRDGQGKWLLRQVLWRHVPRALIERPKMGFGVPIGEWLRGPLRDWAEDLLDPARLAREGYLAPEPVRRAWAEHVSGARNRAYPLWNVLMFQSWLAAVENRSGG